MLPDFNTGRLLIRPFKEGDESLLWPFVSNPEISRDMSWKAHKNLEETRAFVVDTIKRMSEGKTIAWCVFCEGVFCGIFSIISILRTHRALVYDRAEIAYWIGPEFQGKGIMSEAGKKIIEFAFKEMKLHKLVVGHHLNNEKSMNLILRLGFRFSHLEEDVFKKDNTWTSCKFYELTAKNYFMYE